MSTKLTPRHLERWIALHDRLRIARETLNMLEKSLAARYGWASGWLAWLGSTDRKTLDIKWAAVRKIEEKIFAILAEVSPRDWSHGVPAHWVASELTWEDAIRPLGEPLSVVPPLAYGATEALR